jgi:hypothetical protein
MSARRRIPGAALLLLAVGGCASEEGMPWGFATDGELVEVVVHDDGFVTAKEGRMPLEGFVLRMRQHMRALPEEQRSKVLVDIRSAPSSGQKAGESIIWLVDQLQIMGVRQTRYS